MGAPGKNILIRSSASTTALNQMCNAVAAFVPERGGKEGQEGTTLVRLFNWTTRWWEEKKSPLTFANEAKGVGVEIGVVVVHFHGSHSSGGDLQHFGQSGVG